VWKHGFFGQVSSYELGYHRFGPNCEQGLLDNHVTDGWGRLAALLASDNLDPYGPSWEGNAIRFSLMLAPYEGDEPPPALQRVANLFALFRHYQVRY
jgi:hypothetical protein